MASGSSAMLLSLDEVVAQIDSMTIPGPVVDDEDWSDDEFEGYASESEDEQQEGREGEDGDKQLEGGGENGDRLEIGGECEVGEASGLPPYSLTPGCNYPSNNATPIEFFRRLITDS